MRYWPAPSVTALRTFSIRAGLAASTVTPGRTAPDASFTTPAMAPLELCADAVVAASRRLQTTTRAQTFGRSIASLLSGSGQRLRVRARDGGSGYDVVQLVSRTSPGGQAVMGCEKARHLTVGGVPSRVGPPR